MDLKHKKRIIGALVVIIIVVMFWLTRQPSSNISRDSIEQTRLIEAESRSSSKPVMQATGDYILLDDEPEVDDTVTVVPPPILSNWVVQVASFTNPANASRLILQLETAGYPVFERTLTRNQISIIQVFVGPFMERSQADAISSDIQATTTMQVLVRQLETN